MGKSRLLFEEKPHATRELACNAGVHCATRAGLKADVRGCKEVVGHISKKLLGRVGRKTALDGGALDHEGVWVGLGGVGQRMGILRCLHTKTPDMPCAILAGKLPGRAIDNKLIILKERKPHNEWGPFAFEDKSMHGHSSVLNLDRKGHNTQHRLNIAVPIMNILVTGLY